MSRHARILPPVAVLAMLAACEPGPRPDVTAPDLALERADAEVGPGNWSAWSEPVPVVGVNTSADERRPALSKDGRSLYYHSNRGFGANDLWVSQRGCVECPWEPAQNLGPVINTAGFNEAAPALSRDEHWLFFNSNRPGGQGGGDIWASYRSDVHTLDWGAPINLGPGVNSAAGESQASYLEVEGGGAQLYFSRSGTGIVVSDLLPDGSWGAAVPVDGLGAFDGPSVHPNGLEMYVFETFKNHRIWRSTRPSVDAPWSPPVEMPQLTPGVASVFQPFIHAHGNTEELYMCGITPAGDVDIFVSTRTRSGRSH